MNENQRLALIHAINIMEMEINRLSSQVTGHNLESLQEMQDDRKHLIDLLNA